MGTVAKLTPPLVAALVIQSLVSLVPHRHGPAVVAGWSGTQPGDSVVAVVRVDIAHGCLACAVNPPVVEPAERLGIAVAPEIAAPIQDGRSTRPAGSPHDSTSTRGPPGIV
jgi:hypothetical protein